MKAHSFNKIQIHSTYLRDLLLCTLMLFATYSQVFSQDSLVIRSKENKVYKTVEAWNDRMKLKEDDSQSFILQEGKITVWEGGRSVYKGSFSNGEAYAGFPVKKDKIYKVVIEGKGCAPPITYEINTEGYNREGTKVLGFGKRYGRKTGVDWNMYNPGYTLLKGALKGNNSVKPFRRPFKYGVLAKRFRPDSIRQLVKSHIEQAGDFHKDQVEERKEERLERREERQSNHSTKRQKADSTKQRMDSLRESMDKRFVSMTTNMFGKKRTKDLDTEEGEGDKKKKKRGRSRRKERLMEEMIMEDEALADLIKFKVTKETMGSINSKEINYERDKIAASRNNLFDQFSSAETSEDSLQLYLLIQQLDAAEKNLDRIQGELDSHVKEAELQKELADKQKEHLKAEKSRTQILIYGLGIVTLVMIAALYFLLLSRRLNKKVNEQVAELQESNEEILSQHDQIETQKKLVEKKNEHITSSINYAERIQTAILNRDERFHDLMPAHFVMFQPKDIVSGDFYWTYQKDDYFYMAVADCTGHGVPGALLTMLGTSHLNEINAASDEALKPDVILNELRDKIVAEFAQTGKKEEGSNSKSKSTIEVKDGMDISLIRWHGETKTIEWAGANNPLYLTRKANEEEMKADPDTSKIKVENGYVMEVYKGDKEPIGLTRNPTPFKNHSIQLNSGDSIYLFSDGFPDQFGGPNNKKYGYKRFRNNLLELHQRGMEEQHDILTKKFEDWITEGKDKQIDDVCVMGIKVG